MYSEKIHFYYRKSTMFGSVYIYLLIFIICLHLIESKRIKPDNVSSWMKRIILLHSFIFRTLQFPPRLMVNTYKSFKKICLTESGVSQTIIDAFNEKEDFDNIPNNRELKCYMFCQMREMEFVKDDIFSIDMAAVAETVIIFSRQDQDKFLHMGRKCHRLKVKSKDFCDLAYEFNICLKKGDNIVSINHNIIY